ncbi:MAG: acyltransferase [Mucilaginibacter sp.]|nr:acyltransferase [Mucilaginibacter sp.]
MDKRNHLIDLLRFLAASWVAIFHFNEVVPHISNWYRNLLKLGYLGVPIFFVISGYCVYLAALRAKSAKDFLIRRICRIFPPYWFSILIVGISIVLSLVINGVNSVAVIPKTLPGLIATITLSTTPLSKIQIVNWVYWTLTYEIAFYLLIFASLFVKATYRIYWYIFISLLCCFLPVHEHWPLFFIKHWPAFATGVVTYRFLNEKGQLWQNIVLSIITLIGLFLTDAKLFEGITCLITVTLIALNHLKPLKANFFSTLGDYSYSIYLIHVPVAVYMFGAVKQQQLVQTNLLINLAWDITLYSFIVLLSWLMYKYIELPSIRLGKKLTNVSRKAAV